MPAEPKKLPDLVLDELVDQYGGLVYGHLAKADLTPEVREDIFRKTFLMFYRSSRRKRKKGPAGVLLFTLFKKILRRHGLPGASSEDLQPVDPPMDLVERTIAALDRGTTWHARRHYVILAAATSITAVLFFWALSVLLRGNQGPASYADASGYGHHSDRYVSFSQSRPDSAVRHRGRAGKASKRGVRQPPDTGKRSAVRSQGMLSVLGHRGHGDGPASQVLGGIIGSGGGGFGGLGTGPPLVQGTLSKEVIRRVISSHRNQIRYCFERELARNRDLGGKVAVNFTISPKGYVTQSSISESTANNRSLERCITKRVRTWKFPKPKGGGMVTVTYPFMLKASGGSALPEKSEPGKPIRPKPGYLAARGYFKNTYLSGEPRLDLLRRKLEGGILVDGKPRQLEEASRPYRQAFDPPATDGLAVYLNADHSAIEDSGRVIVQVGLKGSQRHARRRASLNAVMLIDLRKTPSEDTRRILWSLADAMAGDLQAGDRFHLVVAGTAEPRLLEPLEFDPSAVRLQLARALQEIESSGPQGNLEQALGIAFGAISSGSAEKAPLGANLLILASAEQAESELDSLLALVHKQSVEGITLTTIGAGAQADLESLGALALQGQGRRRLVTDTKHARRVVETELAASGRVVARAVRLKIRLAEGVKLVELIDSEPLGAESIGQVRELEQAVDLKVADTLGIDADRGEDEEGIQIVIPAFYANDDHFILLDVQVPGPGKVADVQVRYKDLVNLRNAVARSTLHLPAGRKIDSPLAVSVRKNVLATRISHDLQQASLLLKNQQVSAARSWVEKAQARIRDFMKDHSRQKDDPELASDMQMLSDYQKVLTSQPQAHDIRTHLAHSLAYAGRVKLPPGVPD